MRIELKKFLFVGLALLTGIAGEAMTKASYSKVTVFKKDEPFSFPTFN